MAKVRPATGLTLLLLLSQLVLATPATADTVTVKWLRTNIPTEGKAGGWVLASGSDIEHLTRAVDGTLYAYGEGLTYTLYKSSDGGYSWCYPSKVTDAIVDIATSPDDAVASYPDDGNRRGGNISTFQQATIGSNKLVFPGYTVRTVSMA